ncbi:hypothetical protein BIV57_21580 [Mangrovactinospora gilvigrisea]|uniref:Asparagine synthetase domain-containing protein n=1 Tax=Mangrovactinospora gilvigrisea TaxID=1428644 RepID=A0A1J7C1I3_9ACTN|nr:hypothetical protein BIV57_21580 [Mangrovactinospora gilvigrisea]
MAGAFLDSVRELTEDARAIGVQLSGGLDSLATLVYVHRVANGRPVYAFTVDLTDDQGKGAVPVVRRLLRDFGLTGVELVVIDPKGERGVPRWSAAGPRLDALPDLNAVVAREAAARGVDILLSGSGADELLGVPRYGTGAVARRQGGRAAWRYAADASRSGAGLMGEGMAAAARLLPSSARARLYWAMNWPEWCGAEATPVLAEPYRAMAAEWSRAWVWEQINDHAANGRGWFAADAYDAFFPHELIPAAGEVREDSPFLTPGFISAAFAVPLADRYGAALPTPYLRAKALVVGLFPEGTAGLLPQHKQYFSAALEGQAARFDAASDLVTADVGLIDREALGRESDVSVLLAVASLEAWMRGAVERGAVIG